MKRRNLLNRSLKSILILSVCIFGCKTRSYLPLDLYGVYKIKGSAEELILNNKSFVFKAEGNKHSSEWVCCEVISEGSWQLDHGTGFLILKSRPSLDSALKITASERIENIGDTIKVFIENPIEQFYRKSGIKIRDITYGIYIEAENGYLSDLLAAGYIRNFAYFLRPKGVKIQRIMITISPGPLFGGRNIGVKEAFGVHSFKDVKSNIIKIDIPDLTYEFLTYLRVENEFVKILNRNNLMFNGKIYSKK